MSTIEIMEIIDKVIKYGVLFFCSIYVFALWGTAIKEIKEQQTSTGVAIFVFSVVFLAIVCMVCLTI